ncbi:hypothetical protein [Calderihabitans maritimus]|nr:hypothetical protein [Calderihabitans maritimus]
MIKVKIRLWHLVVASFLLTVSLGVVFVYYYLLNKTPLIIREVVETVAVNKTETPKFLVNIGENNLVRPLDVAVDGEGKIYITNSGKGDIQVYNPNGYYLYSFGRFEMPNAIAVGPEGLIYVGEFKRGRIQVFNREGKLVKVIDGKKVGTVIQPLSLSFGRDKLLYVANRTGEVLVLTPEGRLVSRFGKPGSLKGYLSYPNGIAVDPEGNIIVSDSGNKRVQVFDRNGKLLKVLTASQLAVAYPRGIAVDQRGRVFVVDNFGHKVLILDKEFKKLFELGSRGLNEGELNFPNGIAVREGRIYIADRENGRVAVFSY